VSVYRRQIVTAAFAVVAFAAFWQLAKASSTSLQLASVDATVTSLIQSFRSPVLTAVMLGVTALGDTIAVATFTGLVAAWLLRRTRTDDALYVAATVAVGATLSSFAKGAIGRIRPPADNALLALPGSFSFPSGHAMGSLCFAWAFGYLVVTSGWPLRRKVAVMAIVVAYPIAVGISRIYLGVHWPSDILASWLLGGAWVLLAGTIFMLRDSNRRRGADDAATAGN
jgi:undecaprenyl-diphosphatase